MISVSVKTNTTRTTVSTDINTTPRSVFSELGIDTSTSMVNLDGAPFTAADFGKTFEELGVADGSTTSLNAIVKADGAAA